MYESYGYSTGFPTGLIVFLVLLAILMIASMWRIYQKAGRPGWESIIPIYSTYILLKIAGKPGWWLLLFLIPIVNIVFLVWTYNMLSKSFGKDEGFTVGLLLLSFIFFPILGFGSARYFGPYGDKVAFAARQNAGFGFDRNNPGPPTPPATGTTY